MKTKTQHTPGPWRVAGPCLTNPASFNIRNQQGSLLFISGNGWHDVPMSPIEAKANAALIAAAPDLLQALELCLVTLERVKPSRSHDSTQGTRDICRAAIAKATGN